MDEEIDRVLGQGREMPAALGNRIREQIQRDTRPVTPMMGGGAYTLLFAAIVAAVAILFGAMLGFGGLHVLSSMETVVILTVLAGVAIYGGAMAARSMRPGSGSLHVWVLGLVAFAGYELLVVTFFRDYSTDRFMHQGMLCLILGLVCAVFVALPLWIVVRRGFVVDMVRAGAVIGLVGGLAGLGALTLHCPVVTTPHAGVWHAAVVVVSMGLGGLFGRVRSGG